MSNKKDPPKRGLNTEIHPFLRDSVPLPPLPKSYNPLKHQHDSSQSNPYYSGSTVRKPRNNFKFSSAKYAKLATDMQLRHQHKQQQESQHRLLESKGLLPDKALGEELYATEPISDEVAWWDAFYVDGDSYRCASVLDNEHNPVTLYIQHPVFVKPAYEKHLPGQQRMYLTKKELKRKRKNERLQRMKLQQERVRKGLEPPPAPKIKLLNLMSVLTNEAIKDPTAVERRVKKEVEQRYKTHMAQNEQRKLSKEQLHEKHHQQIQRDLAKGYFRNVYKIKQLIDSQHFFKIDKNVQQLELAGVCVVYKDMALIVVEGASKSLRFYDKLVCKRINWQHLDKHDLQHNGVTTIWQGQLKELQFQKWSVHKPQTQEQLTSLLDRFSLQNYWREALVSQ